MKSFDMHMCVAKHLAETVSKTGVHREKIAATNALFSMSSDKAI